MLKLTAVQKKHQKSIEWLLFDKERVGKRGNRQRGRSTLLAYLFIKKALAEPRNGVVIFDHIGSHAATKLFARRVNGMIQGNKRWRERLTLHGNVLEQKGT